MTQGQVNFGTTTALYTLARIRQLNLNFNATSKPYAFLEFLARKFSDVDKWNKKFDTTGTPRYV